MIVLQTVAVAFAMFSAVPVPQFNWTEKNMRYAMCAFPLIGVVIGLLWFLCGVLPLPGAARAAGFCLIPVAATGGIHLDGFADTSDALSSYGDREKKLAILKDPHCGAFAVIRLCSYFAAYLALCACVQFTPQAGLLWMMALVLERTLSGYAVAAFPMAKNTGLAHTFASAADRATVRRVLALLAAVLCCAMLALGGWALVLAALAVLWRRGTHGPRRTCRTRSRRAAGLSAGRTGRLRCADVLRHPHRSERRTANMLIYFLRHGLTEYNAEKRYQGQRDIPLSAAGRAMLRKADIEPQTVYITPLCRTRQTAEVLFPTAKLVVVDGLKEMCFGSFEGRNYIEMEHDPDYLAWVAANCESPCPDGETKAAFSERICRAFSALVDKALADGEELLVILAHGGTQMAALERYALPHKDYYEWCGPNAGGFVLDAADWADKRVLHLVKTVQYTREADV